jgi:Glycosyl hydrolase family 63 C-terminal domain
MIHTKEQERLEAHHLRKVNWKHWGPYLSERGWGTVREDYSEDGEAWYHFTHDQSRSRTYRWNEDGLGGISDRNQYLCFALALWNGRDPILKERLFGLGGKEGNHGEDVKEYYFYLDNTPTHSYMKMLYKYPQEEFPYSRLVNENAHRGYLDFEFELLDTHIFDENRYFDVFIEYAKNDCNDLLIKITAYNRGPQPADLHFLPTLWFRNTWSWGYPAGPMNDVPRKPEMYAEANMDDALVIKAEHPTLGTYYLYAEKGKELIFTENETNVERLYGQPNPTPYVKDAFHRYLVHKDHGTVNPLKKGTKAAATYLAMIAENSSFTIRLRLTKDALKTPFRRFEEIFTERKKEADEFYAAIQNPNLDKEKKNIQRQAFAGLLWSKQLYYYDMEQWLKADAPFNPLPLHRKEERNLRWDHLVNFDILSMPDKWEYPWYASWDLGFHCIPFVLIDGDFAKRQLVLLTREWYMHPNGQFPAYEWNFNDVNPPVIAWAAWRVYKIDAHQSGTSDRDFLVGIFNKLLLNFTWWVNRKDNDGRNVFQGGFLGLDNISVFDRSSPLPAGGQIDQSDATAWMGFYCLLMMKISLELARKEPIYQDTATKFFEHFLRISSAMVNCGGKGHSMWDYDDGFFYDVLHLPGDTITHLKVRSLVGLLPILAVETLDHDLLEAMPIFKVRMKWFMDKRPDLTNTSMACIYTQGVGERHLMAILTKDRLISVLRYMLDENEFLSEYGIRSLSKYYLNHPYNFTVGGKTYTIDYEPAESQTGLFGGNSNWRGPIWFPLNYLIIESLQKFYHYYGDDLKVECPTGSGNMKTLNEVAIDLSLRLMRIFLPDEKGRRPVFGGAHIFAEDPYWRDMILFYEYFHGDNGAGLGASHQTGWTALIAKLIQQSGTRKDTIAKRQETVSANKL